jgi:hypothetical protein
MMGLRIGHERPNMQGRGWVFIGVFVIALREDGDGVSAGYQRRRPCSPQEPSRTFLSPSIGEAP